MKSKAPSARQNETKVLAGGGEDDVGGIAGVAQKSQTAIGSGLHTRRCGAASIRQISTATGLTGRPCQCRPWQSTAGPGTTRPRVHPIQELDDFRSGGIDRVAEAFHYGID